MLTATPGSPLSSAPAPESPNSLQSETAEVSDEKVNDLWTTERYYSFLTGHNEWEEISEQARKKQRTEGDVSSASVPIIAEVAAETAAPAAIVGKKAKKAIKPATKDKPDAQQRHLQVKYERTLQNGTRLFLSSICFRLRKKERSQDSSTLTRWLPRNGTGRIPRYHATLF